MDRLLRLLSMEDKVNCILEGNKGGESLFYMAARYDNARSVRLLCKHLPPHHTRYSEKKPSSRLGGSTWCKREQTVGPIYHVYFYEVDG